jgi:hypothetical protein
MMSEPIFVTAAQVLAARLILERDAAAGRESDPAVIAIATAPKQSVRESRSRRVG